MYINKYLKNYGYPPSIIHNHSIFRMSCLDPCSQNLLYNLAYYYFYFKATFAVVPADKFVGGAYHQITQGIVLLIE
jgi:hypothetical protein